MLTAIITLSLSNWNRSLPLWFPILVVARDVIIVGGCILLRFLNDHLEVRPSIIGKISTFLQMLTISVVLLQWRYYSDVVILAGAVTFVSGFCYIADGIRQLSPHAKS